MNNRNFVTLGFALFIVVQLIAQPTLEFSYEHGFYSSSFKLVIKSIPQDGTICYTLDGSDPRTAEEAYLLASPAEIPIDPYSSVGRAVSPGVVVRACAVIGQDTSKVYSQTYIFLNEVKYQKNVSAELLPYWPADSYLPSTYSPNLVDWMQSMSHYQYIKLNVDPQVIYRDEYYAGFEQDLLSIPTFSLITDPENLFDDSTGIYINGTWSGIDWERPASLELIDPSDDGFQVNTGIRIRGGWSSTGANPKHAFRLYFREQYGDSKLEYPLFGNIGADKFDKIDLRCEQNNSWNAGNSGADYIHDAFSREIQGDMDQPYTRSQYYHLYINGMYWGLYETQERAEASFAESYMGGDKDDYDVVKSSAGSIDYPSYTLEATDGDLNSSKALWDIAIEGFSHDNYFKALGLNPDGSVNTAYPKYLDVDNLISYMMVIYFSANRDGPAALSTTDTRINNFFGIFNRVKPDGFKYCIHDNETAYSSVNDNITDEPFSAGWTFESFNPMWLNQRLMENSDYQQRFADLAYRFLFNDGVLSSERNIARFQTRVDLIDEAIVGESARWGNRTLSRDEAWTSTINRMLQTFLPERTQIVIDQFKTMGWLNTLIPPAIDSVNLITSGNTVLTQGGEISLINSNSTGLIYYTIDNTDPRASDGDISAKALWYSSNIQVTKTIFLKARIKDGNEWSPLFETVVMKDDGTGLLVSEIAYHPQKQVVDNDTLKSGNLEFIEIKNNTQSDIDISGFKITGGICFEFPLETTLTAGKLMVIASDTSSFRKLYQINPFGQFDGNLDNDKEKVILENPCGAIISSIEYNSDETWYSATDGAGYTLVPSGYLVNQLVDMPSNWRASTNWLGSPGEDDPSYTSQPIVFNEILANSKKPNVDFIELKNSGNSSIDIGNWFLTDEKDNPAKWKIPEGTVINAGGFLSLKEGHYVADSMCYYANEFGSSFSLSKGGETIYLYTNGENGKSGSFVTEYPFGATDENISFGKYISNSDNELDLQLETTSAGSTNGNALLSPVIFTTIMYHPTDGNFEYLILKNRSDSTVNLFYKNYPDVTWKINGVGFEFPKGISITKGDSVFIAEKMVPVEEFRSVMNLPSTAVIFNYSGKLSNSGETISIEKPLMVESDSLIEFNYITLESVSFNDKKPWPTNADGDGYALYRVDENAFGNDASNWTSIFRAIPVAVAGDNSRERLNSTVNLDGSASYDPEKSTLTYEWKLVSAPAGSTSSLSDQYVVSPLFNFDKVGNYLFSLVVDNGVNKSIPAYKSVYVIQNTAPVTENLKRTYHIQLDQSLTLGAYDCLDADYDKLTYDWNLLEKPDGSSYELSHLTDKTFNFIPDLAGNYRFTLNTNDGELSGTSIKITVVVSQTTGIVESEMGNNLTVYPNPVINEAMLEFNLLNSSGASIQITAISGQVVSRLNMGVLEAGNHVIPINFGKMEVGLYLITLKTNEFIDNRKVYYKPGN